MSKKKGFKTTIGGQAVLEGVMMKGVLRSAMAIRKPDGSIHLETWDNPARHWYNRKPFIRGIFNFIETLASGYRCLMRSADISTEGLETEEPSKFDRWLEEKCGDKLMKVISAVSSVIGILLALGLFMFLPSFLVGLLQPWLPEWSMSILEGLIKMVILLGYLAAVSLIPDMRRLFQYHGGEHKTIACYEAGEELTVENVRRFPRFHPRCGTSFLFLILLVSILVNSVVTWDNALIRTLLKVVLLPVVVSIAYELIRLAGRVDNIFTRILSWPGLKIQHLTTREPDDDQIEVAIASMKPVLPEVKGEDEW